MENVSKFSLMEQMSEEHLQTVKVQGEVSASVLLKYVLFSDVVPPQVPENLQQTPNPLAQVPSDVPPLAEHSDAV